LVWVIVPVISLAVFKLFASHLTNPKKFSNEQVLNRLSARWM
jgi:hypothetical protein